MGATQEKGVRSACASVILIFLCFRSITVPPASPDPPKCACVCVCVWTGRWRVHVMLTRRRDREVAPSRALVDDYRDRAERVRHMVVGVRASCERPISRASALSGGRDSSVRRGI